MWTRARYGVTVEHANAVMLDGRNVMPARTLPNLPCCQRQLMTRMAQNAVWIPLHDLFRADLGIPPWHVSENVDPTRHLHQLTNDGGAPYGHQWLVIHFIEDSHTPVLGQCGDRLPHPCETCLHGLHHLAGFLLVACEPPHQGNGSVDCVKTSGVFDGHHRYAETLQRLDGRSLQLPCGEYQIRSEAHDGLDTDAFGDEPAHLGQRSDLRRIGIHRGDTHDSGPGSHGEESLCIGWRQRDNALG